MTARLAICLQVCPADVWIAQRLTRLICSVEPELRHDIEFIVSPRRDTNKAAVAELAAQAATRFANVRVVRNKRMGVGWPNGCNDLWQETMMRVSLLYDTKAITATGCLTFESDCLPMRPDWLDVLAGAWEQAQKRELDCVGHAHAWPDSDNPELMGEPTHINGNAIFGSRIILKYPQLDGCAAETGWDVFHGKLLLERGADTPFIAQRYRMKTATREEVEAIRKDGVVPAMFHGIKGTDGLDAVEAMVADGTFFTREVTSIESKVPKT